MAGTALVSFPDFVAATGPAMVRGPKDFVIAEGKRTYHHSRMMAGDKSGKKHVRGGESIQCKIAFKDNATFETYLPGASHSWVNPQRLDTIEAQWRFNMAHMTWVEQEVLLNSRVQHGSSEARFQAYADIKAEKEALMWHSIHNGIEDQLWAVPDKATMETETGEVPYSIAAFVNEDTDGLFNQRVGSVVWTVVETIDPAASATNGNFEPQQQAYTSATLASEGHPINRMGAMLRKVHFEQPKTHKEYWETPSLNKQVICCSDWGLRIVEHALREGQDHFVAGPQDPAYMNPQFRGIEICYVEALDTVKLYNSGSSTLEDEDSANITGPRYYFLNYNSLYPVMFDQRFMWRDKPSRDHNVPDTWVVPVAVWYNLFCEDRRTQGILYPSSTISA